jgi:hypothetical protein
VPLRSRCCCSRANNHAQKRSHMLAAVDAATGVLVSELEIRADEGG